MPIQIGGSFAPTMDGAKVKNYRKLAETAPRAVKDAMLSLCEMMEAFHKQPVSKQTGIPHMTQMAMMVPLETETITKLDPHVPWLHECEMFGKLFDTIDPVSQKELRDAAHHLLWYAVELTQDRTPITKEQLGLVATD